MKNKAIISVFSVLMLFYVCYGVGFRNCTEKDDTSNAIAVIAASAANTEKTNDASKDFKFTENNKLGGVEITKYTGAKIKVNIPSELDGKPVVSIGDSAFFKCKKITDIFVPDSVSVIDIRAFSGCVGLKKITLSKGLTEIGDAAFANCSSLEKIVIPDSVTSIKNGTFNNCENIKIEYKGISYTYEDIYDLYTAVNFNTKISGNYKYTYDEEYGGVEIWEYRGKDTDTIKIPDKIKGKPVVKIGIGVFSYRENLKKINIPKSVKVIGQSAFSGCHSLENISLPDELEEIGNYAFIDSGLKSIKIPDSVKFIGDNVFHGCKHLESAVIGKGVTSIGRLTFCRCENLKRVVIPSSVIEIEDRAFSDCVSLKELKIPKSVIKIDDSAFNYCEDIVIKYNGKSYTYDDIDDLYSEINDQ